MFHICVHIYRSHLHPTLNLILSLRNSQVHTFHRTSPSSPPTLFLDGFAQLIYPVCQRIVSGCAGGLWYLVVLVVLRVLSLKMLCIMHLEGILLLCILCLSVCDGLLDLFLVLTIPIFFYILANGTVQSPSALFWFCLCCCTGGWLIFLLGLNLYRQFRICGSNGIAG